MVKIVCWIVRGKENKRLKGYQPKFLDENVIAQPMAAMYLASKEIERLSEYASEMISSLKKVIFDKKKEGAENQYLEHQENVKKLQEAIAAYITKMIVRLFYQIIPKEQFRLPVPHPLHLLWKS